MFYTSGSSFLRMCKLWSILIVSPKVSSDLRYLALRSELERLFVCSVFRDMTRSKTSPKPTANTTKKTDSEEDAQMILQKMAEKGTELLGKKPAFLVPRFPQYWSGFIREPLRMPQVVKEGCRE